MHFLSGRRKFSYEFLSACALLVQGLITFWKLSWLKMLSFPAVILMTAFYGPGTVIPISVIVPLLGLRTALSSGSPAEEIAFALFLVATAGLSGLVVERVRKQREKALSSLEELKDKARRITLDMGMESLDDEEIMSHYFASMTETDGEIRELLVTVKNAIFADSANLFVPAAGRYALRCSSEEKPDLIITGKGIVPLCFREKRFFSATDLNETTADPGYLRSGKLSSIVAVPILEGGSATGVLVADSARYQAFSETEQNTVKMFAGHMARILERERIYMMIKRDVFGLKILREESYNLTSSLNTEVIVNKLCEAAEKIACSEVFFLLSRGEKFELLRKSGGALAVDGGIFELPGTFINMAVENKQALYISDVTNYRGPVMPFKTEGVVRSVLAIPMSYENRTLGIFVMLSPDRNFLDSFQTDLLKVMCNQAATSIANAALHEKIERLATTDGLTGLFNHRVFQERLAEEFRRINRFDDPLTLLLCDIDFFKKVNDTFGHPAGDVVLKGVAGVIREGIRDIDVPARYGGEEFAVILPGTGAAGARSIAERLRKNVMEKIFVEGGRTFRVTLSIGVATCPADAKTKEELIESADQALYKAKHGGRNQTVLRGGMV